MGGLGCSGRPEIAWFPPNASIGDLSPTGGPLEGMLLVLVLLATGEAIPLAWASFGGHGLDPIDRQ
ncbi:hypothetical protein BRD56_04380 [Thermoplasmatales archaeon SW_10_69_26]|nr:MAG: hypothetical protein BRD56_04380 [Thermoplasmatales archaeon SW_10_69_26]